MSHEAHRRRRIRRRDLHIVMCERRWCVSRRAGVRRSPIASAARSCWQGPGKQGAGPGRSCRPGAERPRTGHRTARGSMLATPTHEPTLDALTSRLEPRAIEATNAATAYGRRPERAALISADSTRHSTPRSPRGTSCFIDENRELNYTAPSAYRKARTPTRPRTTGRCGPPLLM